MTLVAASAVEIRAVDKFYGTFHALKKIDLSIPPGKVTCLIGPSGSGKSSLLRCINFLEEYDAGEIRIDGQLIGYASPGGPRMPARDLRALGDIQNGRRVIARAEVRREFIRTSVQGVWFLAGLLALFQIGTQAIVVLLVATNLAIATSSVLDGLDRRYLRRLLDGKE